MAKYQRFLQRNLSKRLRCPGEKMNTNQDIGNQMEEIENTIARLERNDGNQRKIVRLKFRLAELYGMLNISIVGIRPELDGVIAEVLGGW
jgi:hypothetical protein